ncbi:AMP-binding protein, partial [Neisseria gonorrhoeae]|uniref:AMP-binding protein n=1 Tax=Neisseria gonorrhoeae TaxID=485 RepID=UPI001B7FCFB5
VQRGLKPGEKISTICNNSVEFVKALFGIHRAGLVWVPINTMLGPADMDYILGHAEVRFAIIDDNLHAQADRRAALEARIGELTNSIRDEVVRRYYKQDLTERLYRAFAPEGGRGFGRGYGAESGRRFGVRSPGSGQPGRLSTGGGGKGRR